MKQLPHEPTGAFIPADDDYGGHPTERLDLSKLSIDEGADQPNQEPGETCSEDCQFCSGECCARHGANPCECDVIDRHAPPSEMDGLGGSSDAFNTVTRAKAVLTAHHGGTL